MEGTQMGRGNVRVHGDYEGLYYVDRDYLDCYVSKFADESGDHEFKILLDMECNDFNNFDYDYPTSEGYYDDFLQMFISMMKKKFPSFVPTGNDFGTIMENSLFEIQIEDNEWSYAVELIQKENYWDNCLCGLQKRHHQNYLSGMKDILLDIFPEIGCYSGAWTHSVIKRND